MSNWVSVSPLDGAFANTLPYLDCVVFMSNFQFRPFGLGPKKLYLVFLFVFVIVSLFGGLWSLWFLSSDSFIFLNTMQMMFFLTLISPETSASATWQHFVLPSSILSAVTSRYYWIFYLFILRKTYCQVVACQYRNSAVLEGFFAQNNPEREAGTSTKLLESLIKPTVFPGQCIHSSLVLGSQGLK